MKKILVLLDNVFTNDRRVSREAESLAAASFDVNLVAVKDNDLLEREDINGVKVHRILNKDIYDIKKSSCFKKYASEIVKSFDFDIIHANDQAMLHLGSCIKKINPSVTLVYDSHELFHSWPLNVSNFNSFSIMLKSYVVRKIQIIRERRNHKYIDQIITVNDSLAKDLQNYMKAKKKVCVVRNIPEKSEKIEKTNILREKFGIPQSTKILVFIGANIYARTLNLEQVIDEFANVPNRALVFICGENKNAEPIREYVKAKDANNVYFHGLIAPSDIPAYLSSADAGLVPTWNKHDMSYWYALDNKLFEYINAGIPVLATQQPEYRNIVENYKCGVCVNPDEKGAYIRGFEAILADYAVLQQNTSAASQVLTWENEQKKLVDLYKSL
ncbi:MAG: glycosyltransferase [Bacteroidales bacterium]|nr:glycosyltransferase [Bacteroidales bacterium]